MKRNNLVLTLFLAGLILIVASQVTITGAVVGASGMPFVSNVITGLSLIFVSMILFATGDLEKKLEKEKTEKIGNLNYDGHAVKRMEQRHIFPTVVEDAIQHGTHYHLKHTDQYPEAKGATEVYIKEHTADIESGGKIGERIIHVHPGKREYNNLLVLTDKNGTVKTTFIKDDTELKNFYKKYIE